MTLSLQNEQLDLDWQVRLAAFDFITRIRDESKRVRWGDLQRGFEFNGDTIHVVAQSGIFRPKQLREFGAALTIRTAAPNTRQETPYDDQVDPNTDLVEYRYRRGAHGVADNESLRRAGDLRRPLIWLYGLTEGVYQAEFPVWVVQDDPTMGSFQISVESGVVSPERLLAGGLPELKKRYSTIEAKKRLHQARFREMVLGAYKQRCTVCSLGTTERLARLLDAAHILEDRDEQGKPEIPNGLALCKIHHSAYDLNILGISPGDHRVQIRHDILDVVDGPMLQHGIKGMDGEEIALPRRPEHRPREEFLSLRFDRFRAA